jgi:hypothetical protein
MFRREAHAITEHFKPLLVTRSMPETGPALPVVTGAT